MKTGKLTLIALAAFASFSACTKEETPSQEGQEIIIAVNSDNIDMNASTKASATAVTSLPGSLYWSATTGTLGSSETSKYASASGTVTAGTLATGKYQTASATSYNYYLSNQAITFGATGSTVAAANTTDVIVGKVTSNTATPAVTMNHVFARVNTLTCNTQSGYNISNVSWKIQGVGTAGTYNIATGAWSGVTALAQQAIASGDDLYVIPGSYTFTVSYTLTKGDYTQNFTKSGSVTLVGNKKNNITCTAIGGSASDINLSVTLTDWTEQNHTLTLS